jgi:formate-nitrite transporter family protein
MDRATETPTLVVPVNEHDWIAGPADAPVTFVEYADFECPDVRRMEPIVQEVRRLAGDNLRYIYRHFPLTRKHAHALQAAEAAEAAGAQGAFWEMHDLLLANQDRLTQRDLARYAAELGLDTAAFEQALNEGSYEPNVRRDYAGGALSGADGTPTFYLNGVMYDDWYELRSLLRAVEDAVQAAR